MKKLITVILILVLLLPVLAIADTWPDRIIEHYSLLIDSHEGRAMTAVGSPIFGDFDSFTLDWYVLSDGKTGYILETECVSGVFLNHGVRKVTRVDRGGTSYLVDDDGNHLNIMTDDDGTVWIEFGYGYCRMQKVTPISAYTDRQ